MNRRELLRQARYLEKVRVEVGEALGIQGKEIPAHVMDAWTERAQVEAPHDVLRQVLRDAEYHLAPPAAAAVAAGSQQASSMCAFCKRKLCAEGCPGLLGQPELPAAMLEDEYAMLAMAQADRAQLEAAQRREADKQQRRAYASQLDEMVRERKRAQDAQLQEKLHDHQTNEACSQQWRAEQASAAKKETELKKARLDELDRFCADQHTSAERARRQDLSEEARLQALRGAQDLAEQQRAEALRGEQRAEAERIKAALAEQQVHRRSAEHEERSRDLRYMKLSEDEEARRQARREQERLAVQEKHERISATVGTQMGRVEQERREKLEQACERWEREKLARDARADAEKDEARRLRVDDMQRTLAVQVQSRHDAQAQEAQQHRHYADALAQQIRAHESAEQEKRRAFLANRQGYGRALEAQMQDEKAMRKQRLLIGMDDRERKLNQPLLHSLDLTDASGNLNRCWTGLCTGAYCTCAPAIRAERYQVQSSRAA